MDSLLKKLCSVDEEKITTALEDLTKEISDKFAFPALNERDYRAQLWKALYDILLNENYKKFHTQCLHIIRILSREKKDINELVNQEYLNMILRHAGLLGEKDILQVENHKIAIEALMCLCNITFNGVVPRALCCKNGTSERILYRLHTLRGMSNEMKHFDIKILFIISALCTEMRETLKHEMHGLAYLIEALDLILKELNGSNHNADVTGEIHKLSDIDLKLTIEILKTLFNLTLQPKYQEDVDEEDEQHYLKLARILRDLLLVKTENVEKKLDFNGHIMHLLLNIPDDCLKPLIPLIQIGEVVPSDMQYGGHNMMAVHEILDYLKSRFIPEPEVTNQKEVLSPILTAMVKLAKADRVMRKYLRAQILPPLRDIHTRPEQGSTIRNYLCRLLTTPITQVRDLTSDFLFVLCKENAGRMIKYTGYGNAAGMFAMRGLLSGNNGETEKYSSDSENSDTDEYNEFKHGINPVTGCYQEPRPSATANMTEEQKEYEAMKLVELMDNLTRKGIVQPCTIGLDGKPQPIKHVLQLQEGRRFDSDEDDDD